MRALVFLTTRTIVNSVRRALKSPKRLLGVLFFVAYYLWLFGPVMNRSQRPMPIEPGMRLDFPALDVIEAVVFGGFCVATVMMATGMLTHRGGFRAADVEVLFPTPISPKVVLIFRLIRDYLLTLILPLFFAIVLWRPAAAGWTAMFRDVPNPASSSRTLQAVFVAWLLMASAWVAIGYAVSLYLNRSGPKFERLRKWTNWGIFGGILAFAAYVGLKVLSAADWGELLVLCNSLVLRVAFFLATFATELSLAPLTGNWLQALAGLGGLLLVIAGSLALALAQSGWLYDQVSVRTSLYDQTKELQRSGNVYGLAAVLARTGKVKAGRRSWVHKLRVQGVKALLWKEYLLQSRAMRAMVLAFGLIGIVMPLFILFAGRPERSAQVGYGVLFVQALFVFLITAEGTQAGFQELLRRVDLQKPLPFAPRDIVLTEVLAQAVPGAIVAWLSSLLVVLVAPSQWAISLTSAIVLPTVALLISAIFLLITLWFPESEDPTQRGLRGLVMVLAFAGIGAPGILLLTFGAFAGVPLPLVGFGAGLTNVALALAACQFGGETYAGYNPSE